MVGRCILIKDNIGVWGRGVGQYSLAFVWWMWGSLVSLIELDNIVGQYRGG